MSCQQRIRINLLLFLSFSIATLTMAQRGANWHFGRAAAIKFTNPGNTTITGSAINTAEGCATMSDDNGNLLFYTDGVTVWNKNNAIMANGTGLRGNNSSAQSSIVVPEPGNNFRYYIFTSVQVEAPLNEKQYCWNIVDMRLGGGLGAVVVKNIIFDSLCSERLTVANHANGTDYWVLTNTLRTNTFKAYLLTASGLSTQPIISNTGLVNNQPLGMMKVSNDGQWLVQTGFLSAAGSALVQLFRFNNLTGRLSNPIQLNTPNGFNCAYGCAFSPNSNRVYIGCTNPNNGFLQFTIGTGVDSSVNRSRVWLNANTPIAARGFGDFSTAIDGRLYIAREDSRRISAISNPNDTGTNINFIDTAILLPPGSACFLGLPNFYNNINTPTTSIEANNLSCLTYTFRFTQVNNFNFNGLYRWDFGDGSPISTASTPTHTYARNSNDSFLVTLNFRSPDNAVSIVAQIWIRLPAKPLANFTANTNGCVGSPIVLSSNTTTINGSISSYHWSFGDNTTDTVELPIKRYGDTGTYTIKLAATDALGCRSDTAVQSININQKLVANFFSNGLNCSNTDIPIIDTSIAINTSINTWWYRWQNGANSYTSNTSGNFLISFPSEGLYSIQQVVSNNNNGCTSDTTTKLLFVFQKPQANFLLPNNCVRDRSVFTQTATVTGQTSINSWRWNFGDTTTNSDTLLQPNGTYQYANPGNYNVQLIVSTNRGCSDTSNQTFTVNGAIPKASIRFLNNPNCSGDSTIITNQSSVDFGQINRLTINWGPTLTIDTATAFNKPYRYLYNSFGTPTSIRIPIIISAASGINCVSTLDTFVTLLAQPKVRFNLPIDSICGNSSPILLQEGIELAGASGTFLYNGLGVQLQINNTYTWNPQLANNNTTNTIRYIFTTSAGCADTASQTVFVHPFPIANAGQPRTMFEGESIILNGTVLGAYNALLWLPSQLITPANSLQPTVRATQDTTLTFIATNLQGCSDTSSVRLTVLPKIKPPNSFSPNNDGINDTWILPNIEQYPNATVSIFNRHGQTIVERKPYHKPWNGTYRNMPAPVGTYYYLIHLQADKPPLSGWLLLLR